MFLTEITADDLVRLEQCRMKRLLHFFGPSLPRCLIYLDADSELNIYCPNSEIVDELLDDLEDLCNYAWLILGVRAISLYFCYEEILHMDTKFTIDARLN
jgi:hypothetical protein